MKREDFARQLPIGPDTFTVYDIQKLEAEGLADISGLPFSIKVLVENLMRHLDGRLVTEADLLALARWQPQYADPVEIPFHPGRVLMQDFTGVPAVVDLAAMRDAVRDLGGDARRINPRVPVELVVDHSVQVDAFGTVDALEKNVAREYERNGERYALLKWAQRSFANFKVVPPNSGICHQVNLEHLGRVVVRETSDGSLLAYPDTLVGTDSHTPMINGIGVLGWGVGGIEAEAVMLGQPYYMTIPEVIGIRLNGALNPGVTATDLVLALTELLRQRKVVEKFVEYFGPGLANLSVADRATIANMTPENGSTLGFFPVDARTIEYLRLTDRPERARRAEAYCRAMGLFAHGDEAPVYSETIDFDLGTVVPAVAGPARPQDRIALGDLKPRFEKILGGDYPRDAGLKQISTFVDESGSRTQRPENPEPGERRYFPVDLHSPRMAIGNGSIVIAAITSCTNTSNPAVMLGAGLLARNAVRRGLRVPGFVKTSLAPGSKVVLDYLTHAGLMPYLEALGFHVVGFGCTTCIGNSGPLHPEIDRLIRAHNLTVASVLSGNRNFEARIHQAVRANFLASPLLVVALALAGRIDIDVNSEPLGFDPNGEPVFLEEIWPSAQEIQEAVQLHLDSAFFKRQYGRIFDGDKFWRGLEVAESTTFAWDGQSTYIKDPPYFEGFSLDAAPPGDIAGARVLMALGDTVTTDHISPAGAIPADYPAGRYLQEKGVAPEDFNSYGSRRGNHEVMMRGTFGNIRIKNVLVSPTEGSFTRKFPQGGQMSVYDAAMAYREEGIPLIVLAGKEYGTGSSRDWAAKGTLLLGVRAVLAESYERIHRANLVGMGVLPLVFEEGQSWRGLGLDGSETYAIEGIAAIAPRGRVAVRAVKADGGAVDFKAAVRLDTEVEVDYFRHGGILPYVLRRMMG
ncbi:MAG: aconitate hydratase AcnA, partial [Desulfobacteraceae bacterium]|nr:aconitate hydratase AcnA [Desulfobacteraceae bacterium]